MTLPKPETITAVVITRALPTVTNVRWIASGGSCPASRSWMKRIRKWIVSSTAMPRQMAKAQALEMSSEVPKKTARSDAVAASGKTFGMIDSRPSRNERNVTVMTRKIMTAARAIRRTSSPGVSG